MKRIVCLGGGPAGLYSAILFKKALPNAQVESVRAQPAGRHVRLGRRVLRQDDGGLSRCRSGPHDAIVDSFYHWDDIDVHFAGSGSAAAATAFAASRASAC
jgi:anthraniloyl-CoA monooxygenase